MVPKNVYTHMRYAQTDDAAGPEASMTRDGHTYILGQKPGDYGFPWTQVTCLHTAPDSTRKLIALRDIPASTETDWRIYA